MACSAQNDKLCADQRLVCKTGGSECVVCNGASDCKDPKNSACNAESKCEPCATSADCAHLSDTPVCRNQQCVACAPGSRESCGNNVCDMISEEVPVCAEGKAPHSVTACQACVSDEQCQEGQLCVRMEWQDEKVGHFCLWKQSTTVAPLRLCNTADRPYVASAIASGTDAPESTAVCALTQTTCPAIAAHRKSCGRFGTAEDSIVVEDVTDSKLPSPPPEASEINPDASVCGPASSALCKPRTEGGSTDPNGAYVCTTPCGLDRDCPEGFACKGVTPGVPGYCSF